MKDENQPKKSPNVHYFSTWLETLKPNFEEE